MQTNNAGLELIKRNEGCRLTAYRDVVNVLTIGWGHTGPDVYEGMTITQAQADQMLVDRLSREFEPGVLAAIGNAETTENQFSAMVSLAYNIGVGRLDDPKTPQNEASGFKGSTVARMHRAGNYTAAANAFLLWNKAGGKIFAGLTRRRQEEADLYLRRDATAVETVSAETAAPPAATGDPSPGMVVGKPAAEPPIETLKAIQVTLKEAGYYVLHRKTGKPLIIDGDFGEQSRAGLDDLLAAAGQRRL